MICKKCNGEMEHVDDEGSFGSINYDYYLCPHCLIGYCEFGGKKEWVEEPAISHVRHLLRWKGYRLVKQAGGVTE